MDRTAGTTRAAAEPSILSRSDFIGSATEGCVANQRDHKIKLLTDEQILSYCQCFTKRLAEQVTEDELAVLAKGILPDTVQAKMTKAGYACGGK